MPKYILNGMAAMGDNDESARAAADEFRKIITECVGIERQIRHLGSALMLYVELTEKECTEICAAFRTRFNCTLECCDDENDEPAFQSAMLS